MFLCYSRSDRKFVRRFYRYLLKLRAKRPAASVFFDEMSLRPGEPVSPDIVARALIDSALIVVLCGRDTARSVEVNREITLARQHNIDLLPVIITQKVPLPADLDFRIQGVSANTIFRFRIIDRAIVGAAIALFLVLVGTIFFLRWQDQRQQADFADQRRRDRLGETAAAALRAGDYSRALLFSVASLPMDARGSVPTTTPVWLIREYLATASAPLLDGRPTSRAKLPPIADMGSFWLGGVRNSPEIPHLDCNYAPLMCDWGPISWSADERWGVLTEGAGRIVLIEFDAVNPLHIDENRDESSQPFRLKRFGVDRPVTSRVTLAEGSVVRAASGLMAPGIRVIDLSPCTHGPDTDETTRPCRITGAAFLRDLLVLGLQDGRVLGLGVDGSLRWATRLAECGLIDETRDLANCAIREMVVADGRVFAGVDNGAAVIVSRDGTLVEAPAKSWPRRDMTLGTGAFIGWMRSDHCFDDVGATNDCAARQSWFENSQFVVVSATGVERRWSTGPNAIRLIKQTEPQWGDQHEMPDASPMGDSMGPPLDRTALRRLTDDRSAFAWSVGSGSSVIFGVQIFSRNANRVVERIGGSSTIIPYRGGFLKPVSGGLVQLGSAAAARAELLPPAELRAAFCTLMKRDDTRRKDFRATVKTSGGNAVRMSDVDCGLTVIDDTETRSGENEL